MITTLSGKEKNKLRIAIGLMENGELVDTPMVTKGGRRFRNAYSRNYVLSRLSFCHPLSPTIADVFSFNKTNEAYVDWWVLYREKVMGTR